MSSTPEIRFRLSIWRPAILDRTYLYGDDDAFGLREGIS